MLFKKGSFKIHYKKFVLAECWLRQNLQVVSACIFNFHTAEGNSLFDVEFWWRNSFIVQLTCVCAEDGSTKGRPLHPQVHKKREIPEQIISCAKLSAGGTFLKVASSRLQLS